MELVLLKPGLDGLAGGQLFDAGFSDAAGPPSGCIELLSMHFGMRQAMNTDAASGARTSGRPALQDITVVRYIDNNSPLLYQHCRVGCTPSSMGLADRHRPRVKQQMRSPTS